MSTRKTAKVLLALGMIGGALALAHSSTALAQDSNPDPLVPSSPDSAVAIIATPPPLAPVSDVLPFAKNELPTKYPSFGMGGGVGSYRADLGGVDKAFRAMEDVYRAQGYSVPGARGTDLDVMKLMSLTVRCSRALDVALQLGRSDRGFNRLGTTGVLVSDRFLSTKGGALSLFAGLGGGTYGFSFARSYGATVSPYDANGGYTTLDKIVLEGGGGYWTGAGGVTLRPGSHVAVDLRAQYVGMTDKSTDTERAGRISMDLSGVVFGGTISLFL